MKNKENLYASLLLLVIIIQFSCKTTFPPAGTSINCNGTMLAPVINPIQKPEFYGGTKAMTEYFRANLTPSQFVNISKLKIAFVVTKEGNICNVRIISKPNDFLEDQIIRIIKNMPNWKPGINNGNVVDAYVLIGFKFNKTD